MTHNFISYSENDSWNVQNNVNSSKNLISPFCNEKVVKQIHPSYEDIIDINYGFVYDKNLICNDSVVYGYSDLIPDSFLNKYSNYGFLRTPFKKVSRVIVNNRYELEQVLRFFNIKKSREVLFRGQNVEYYVSRTEIEKLNLYGDLNVLEPTLTSSCVRKNISLDDFEVNWSNIVQLFLHDLVNTKRRKNDLEKFISSLHFPFFLMSLAQHYGLPSVGLDTTDSIEIALFFATHKFSKIDTHYKYEYNLPSLDFPPVIYILLTEIAHQTDFYYVCPKYVKFLRPNLQSAKFIHSGWGYNRNRSATNIILALYLNPKGDFGIIPKQSELFPKNDPFISHIVEMLNYIDKAVVDKYFYDMYY